ncbi:uncharacterized protein [Asterias amurensis]|uniref:uncharacterized protein isoform X6 n=1 Tax=Asterias amurensis TaxID=7602 RepID=UPI003AB351FE
MLVIFRRSSNTEETISTSQSLFCILYSLFVRDVLSHMWHQLTSAIMSDVLIQLCLKSAIVLIATTCIPVLLGAPITSLTTSLPEVQQPSTPLDIATCGKNSYWDIELAQCKPCVTCPMGMGSTVSECGYGNGEIGRCEECDDGYYQDQTVTKGPCNRCSSCDSNRIVLSDCTKTTNTECGPCKEGYGQQPNHPDLCSACYLFNDDEKPPECLTLTPTPGLASVTDTDECLPGYVYRLNKCVDINECDVPYSCDSSVSRCSNTDGSFTCQCLPGFEMNSSGECVDTDECALNQDTCNTSVSTCHNTKGSYRCECLPGYVMDRLNECVDTDECAQNQDTCNTSVSTCHNTKGSYRCECLPGYVMDRLNECVDINECDVPYSCDSSVSRCSNTDGSFTCQCLPGFEMNSSGECVDSPDQGWVVALVVIGVVAAILLTTGTCLYRLYVRWQKRQNQQTGSQQNSSEIPEMVTLGSENVVDGNAPTNGDVKQQSNSHASNHAPDTGDNTTEESALLLGDGTSTVEQTDNSIEEASPDDSLFGNPISEEPSNENERPLPLGEIPTRPMADSQKPKVMRKRFLSEGNNPDEAHSTPSLTQKVRNKCKEAERKSKEENFEDSFQKACSCGGSIHWEDLECGIRKKCSQMMTPVDRSGNQVSSNDFRILGEMLKLKPKTDLKECKDLEGVFALLHSSRSVPVDLEEVLQKLREIPRMDVVRVLVEEIVKKKPTCRCVS